MTPPEGAAPQLGTFEYTASAGAAWTGTPVVNGHQILTAEGITIELGAHQLPVVTLRLIAGDALRLALGEASFVVSDTTRDALISIGWTPPPGHAGKPRLRWPWQRERGEHR